MTTHDTPISDVGNDSPAAQLVHTWLRGCAPTVQLSQADHDALVTRIDAALTQEQFKVMILRAQLEGWEAACAAQVQAIEALLPVARMVQATTVIAQAEAAISTDVGRMLLERLNRAEAAAAHFFHCRACCEGSDLCAEGQTYAQHLGLITRSEEQA